ncbi:MAG: 50S ribosomal protein L3 [Eubacteriales bacterium]|nr:50S ribosomal protein L3 [Eubacteriales bacterium]
MKKAIYGTKIGMTQIFNEDGLAIPVTVIKAGPCAVIQKKTLETDGYEAVKIGFEDKDVKKLSKPEQGQFTGSGLKGMKYLRELRLEDISAMDTGSVIKVEDMFAAGEKVDVSGVSKGKGFQGNIKRHGQKGGKDTHGSMYHRRVGSMGANSSPSKVLKGKKLPGHMGFENVTVLNLDVVRVDAERSLLLVKGAVPGPRGALLLIKNTVKSGK